MSNLFEFPEVPLTEISVDKDVQLFIKREDLIHPFISGNKFWKLFYQLQHYLASKPKNPLIVTFGGAYSNHIAATAYCGKYFDISTLGLIRGEELSEKLDLNATLNLAAENGMQFRFVSREQYREKADLKSQILHEFPEALLIEEGGTNELAVSGIRFMLSEHTKDFHYLCTAVGTGGTIAGISKYCEPHQKVLGFSVVKDFSLESKIIELSGKNNFKIFWPEMRYGKITDEDVRFINTFYEQHRIPLDPVYTGKMIKKLMQLIDDDFFAEGSKILAFHTGGLQGIEGANQMLRKKKRDLIQF